MKSIQHSALWLTIAIVLLVGQTLVQFVRTPTAVGALSVGVAVFFASLLSRGSKFAWVVLLVGAIGQFVIAALSTADYGSLAVGSVAAICLLAPPSVRIIWFQPSHQRVGVLSLPVERSHERVRAWAWGILLRVADWENEGTAESATHQQRSYRLLLWRLGVGCVLLLVLVGLTETWAQGAESINGIALVVAGVVWVCYAVVQLAFIAAVIVAVYRHY